MGWRWGRQKQRNEWEKHGPGRRGSADLVVSGRLWPDRRRAIAVMAFGVVPTRIGLEMTLVGRLLA